MTKRSKTYEGPLTLDMDFGEALARFGQTDPKELSALLDQKQPGKGTQMAELTWTKELSTTDAQQPTSGGLVGYLRLTRGSLSPHTDWQSWFRQTLFGGAKWVPGHHGRETDIEVADIVISVSLNGVKLGDKTFPLTHGPNRWKKNNTPNTWLHWPKALKEILMENDMTDWPVTLTRQADGKYRLDIQAAKT